MKMKSRRMDEAGRQGHFSSEEHALAAGMLLGELHKAMADSDEGITLVQPFMDGEGNYTNQMLVQINGRAYTVTIDEAIGEAMDL